MNVARDGAVAVCLVVPHGTHQPAALAAAVSRWHPTWTVGALWAGDPQLQPPASGLQWWNPVDAAERQRHERLLLAEEVRVAEWCLGLRAAGALLDRGFEHVVLLWVGAVAVLGPVDALVHEAGSAALTVVPLVLGALPDDGAKPDETDLVEAGRCSTDVLVVHRGAEPVLDWLAARLAVRATRDDLEPGDEPVLPIGRWLQRAVEAFDGRVLADPAIGASVWRWGEVDPALIDVPGFDADRPFLLAPTMTGRGRIAPTERPDVQRSLAVAAEQLVGARLPLTAPGGLVIDDTVRAAVRRAVAAGHQPTIPSPWSAPQHFREWLAPRFWEQLHRSRSDLRRAFPDPSGDDHEGFTSWQERAFVDDSEVSILVQVVPTVGKRIDPRPDAVQPRPLDVRRPLRRDGLNVVGYHTREASLGDVVRRLSTALGEAGVDTSTIAYQRSSSPDLPVSPHVDSTVQFDASLAVVTADHFASLRRDHPQLFGHRLMVGYWFWELEDVPRQMRAAMELVDEVWAGSRFVTEAFARVGTRPVHHVPIPVPQPVSSGRARASFGPLADLGERFTFLVVFDHFSITERKNPIAAIRAFREAFPPGAGPVLVVKSMNGAKRWRQHQAVLAAAAGRDDIRCWDEHLSRADAMALVETADCFVSLHRSEGLGLHLAEAMWLGTPTIATRYSGNLDFQDDDTALLVDAGRVRVGADGQGIYPPTSTWADPDVGAAAEAMRRIAGDAALCQRLAQAGRTRMAAQPDLATTGRRVAELAGVGVPGTVSGR